MYFNALWICFLKVSLNIYHILSCMSNIKVTTTEQNLIEKAVFVPF